MQCFKILNYVCSMNKKKPEEYTIASLAKKLKKSKQTIYNRVNDGTYMSKKVGAITIVLYAE